MAWESTLDGGDYSSGDIAVGEQYNDSAFDDTLTINGGSTVGLNSIRLGVASGEKHDGTAGTGVRDVASTHINPSAKVNVSGSVVTTVEDTEWNANKKRVGGTGIIVTNHGTAQHIVRRCILHGNHNTSSISVGLNASQRGTFLNNAIYDIVGNHAGGADGMRHTGSSLGYHYNNSIWGTSCNNAGGHATGSRGGSGAFTFFRKNNIVQGTNGPGTINDYTKIVTSPVANQEFDIDSDGTAPPTNALHSQPTQFISTASGAENLNLAAGVSGIDSGKDLGTFSGVNFDIHGTDRDADGLTWNRGASEQTLGVGGLVGRGLIDSGLIDGMLSS